MRLILVSLATALVLTFAAPSMAFHCPLDIAKIDKALAMAATIAPDKVAKAKELRDLGEKLHNAGDHAKAVEVLAEALKLLGM